MKMEIDKLYLGNCLGIMKEFPNECVDCIITDSPYKLNYTSGSQTSSAKQDKWQGNLIAGDKTANIHNDIKFSDWLPDAFRIMKEGHFYSFVNDKNLHHFINEAEKVGFLLHNILVWKKNNKTPNRWYMKNCEFIVFMRKGRAKPINNLNASQLLECRNLSGKEKEHPTQKPIEILEMLIENSTNESDIVLDMFMGSGSTCLASKLCNRKYVGIEIDEKHFSTATNRIMNCAIGKKLKFN